MASDQENEEKLQYAARLSGLWLNEGTDVMRWFLMDNLPRSANGKPNLNKLLKENKKTFEELLENEKGEQLQFSQEMFDIIYPPTGSNVDEANMEITLIFILIRYLCKLKHPSWRWWEEEPQPHQRVPVFDVIRLARFKERMKNVVHNYEITKEAFEQSLKYLTNLVERLRGYKSSAQRWEGDIISYEENENISKERKTVDLVSIMRWQTLSTKKRNATYLVLKENFHRMEKNDRGSWENFISCFGQMTNLSLCQANELEEFADDKRVLVAKSNDISNRSYMDIFVSPAKTLNWSVVHDLPWKMKMQDASDGSVVSTSLRGLKISQEPKTAESTSILLTPMERQIYSSVDDRVFIPDLFSESPILRTMREEWKNEVIRKFSKIRVFPFEKEDEVRMDEIKTNLSTVTGELLSNWTDAIPDSDEAVEKPLRIMIRGHSRYGKTTLLQKIAYNRATMNCPQLQQYDLVFFIELSKVKLDKPYTRLSDCITRHCFGEDSRISPDDVENQIRSRNGRGILFLFDAVDDLPICDEASEICDLIRSDMWWDCAIVVAKRTTPYYMEHNGAEDLFKESRTKWHRFNVDGFRVHDVCQEIRRRVGRKSRDSNAVARHLLNLVRVYQRDIYVGRNASPILVSIIYTIWKEIFDREKLASVPTNSTRLGLELDSHRALPETLGRLLDVMLASYFNDHSHDVGEFEQEICRSTLKCEAIQFQNGDNGCGKLQKLKKLGVIRDSAFTHPLLQDFFASKIYCSSTASDFCLKKHIVTATIALSLQDFLSFCCELDTAVAEEVLDILGNLTSKGDKYAAHMLRLSLRCFYSSRLGIRSEGQRTITASIENLEPLINAEVISSSDSTIGESDLITANLAISQPHRLSRRTQQSLLKFTSSCRPPLTSSGTVFPLLRPLDEPCSTSYIRSLHISEIRRNQAIFASEIISRLPFLGSVALTGVEGMTAVEFQKICHSLNPRSKKLTSSLHSLTMTFKNDTSFDSNGVPTYEGLSAVLHKLPFLESLKLAPLTYKHFMSIYDDSNMVVPLENIQLSRRNLTTQQCIRVVEQLRRTNFAVNLDLSHNPIHDGLEGSKEAFAQFSTLKTVNLEQCCLTAPTVAALSTCFRAPRLWRTVTSINLRGNHVDDQTAWMGFVESLGHFESLQSLDLSQNFLQDRVICVLSSQLLKLKRLRHLLLDYVQMGDIGLSSIISHITSSDGLEVLSLGENPLRVDALRLLSELRGTKISDSLTELNISGISSAAPHRISTEGAREAGRALHCFTNIRTLDLSCTSMTYSNCVTILEAAEGHGTLKELRLDSKLLPLREDETARWTCLSII